MNILITGGAGYIGSHMVRVASDKGHAVTVLDNLVGGFRDAVDTRAEFVLGDIADRALLDRLLSRKFDGVMHFASFIQVGESVVDPRKYYHNNVINSHCLMDALVANGINNLIFSSSAAVFGNPLYSPIDELHPLLPINPYGRSKLMVEQMLSDYDVAYGLNSVCLRYFNAAGAMPDGSLGERHDPETHLIPLVLQVASGRRQEIHVYGNDYDTPDGTCIRDYIHVVDLCDAHMLALDWLMAGKGSAVFNLGNDRGYSVSEVIDVAASVTQRKINSKMAPRRAGDPSRLIADSAKSRSELGWNPKYSELDMIIKDAWRWHSRV